MLSHELLIFGLFAIAGTETQAILIKSGVLQDHARDLNGGIFDYDSNRGISSHILDDGFHADNERKHVGNQDTGRYSHGLADNKQILQENDFLKDNFYRQGAGGLSSIDHQLGEKIGHHNTGFTNSYHKDETGSKSNYYDVSDNLGNKFLQNAQQGLYGDIASSKNRNANFDGGRYHQGDSRFGLYDNQGLYGKNFGTRRNYNQQNYNDDRALRGQSNAADRIGESGRYVVEDYGAPYHHNFGYSHPGHYHSVRRSHVPIHENIYEDGVYSSHPYHGSSGPNYFRKEFYY